MTTLTEAVAAYEIKLDEVVQTFALLNTPEAQLQRNNEPLSGLKTATFYSELAGFASAGEITLNWSAAQNQRQPTPTGAITYVFINPPGPCHLQLLVDSSGASSPQVFAWPANLVWFGQTWSGIANKRAIVNFWFDGATYSAMGANQV